MNVLTDIAAICGSITVILIFLAAIARIRWVRWIWGHLVSDPVGRWLKGVVADGASEWHAAAVEPRLAAIEKQLLTNDGSTLRDEVIATKAMVERIMKDRGLPPGIDPTERAPVPS